MSASSALAPVSIRLAPVRRIEIAQRLITLVTAALLLRHDHAERLAKLRADQFYSAKTDRVLLVGIASLTAFVRDRAEDGITLPEWHPCYVSSAVVEEGE